MVQMIAIIEELSLYFLSTYIYLFYSCFYKRAITNRTTCGTKIIIQNLKLSIQVIEEGFEYAENSRLEKRLTPRIASIVKRDAPGGRYREGIAFILLLEDTA